MPLFIRHSAASPPDVAVHQSSTSPHPLRPTAHGDAAGNDADIALSTHGGADHNSAAVVGTTGSRRGRSAGTGTAAAHARAAAAAAVAEAHAAAANAADTTETKAEQRRAWNRANAKKSRQRKKCLMESMSDRLTELTAENARLRGLLVEHHLADPEGGHHHDKQDTEEDEDGDGYDEEEDGEEEEEEAQGAARKRAAVVPAPAPAPASALPLHSVAAALAAATGMMPGRSSAAARAALSIKELGPMPIPMAHHVASFIPGVCVQLASPQNRTTAAAAERGVSVGTARTGSSADGDAAFHSARNGAPSPSHSTGTTASISGDGWGGSGGQRSSGSGRGGGAGSSSGSGGSASGGSGGSGNLSTHLLPHAPSASDNRSHYSDNTSTSGDRDRDSDLLADAVALDAEDYDLLELVSVSHTHFLITNPNLPGNPITFASSGFHELTGYSPDEVIGRNCRFLQGRDSDPREIVRMRAAIAAGVDCHTVILNYKKDGTPFYNDIFIAPLRDPEGRVVHFVGVQRAISPHLAARLLRLQDLPISEALEASTASTGAGGGTAAAPTSVTVGNHGSNSSSAVERGGFDALGGYKRMRDATYTDYLEEALGQEGVGDSRSDTAARTRGSNGQAPHKRPYNSLPPARLHTPVEMHGGHDCSNNNSPFMTHTALLRNNGMPESVGDMTPDFFLASI